MNFVFRNILASAFVVSAIGCGGGGGGGGGSDFVGAANVTMLVQPNSIDTGDQAEVRAIIGEVNANGIALKFRFPAGLRFVPRSASLTVNQTSMDLTPQFNVTSENDNENYVVFFLAQSLFRTSGQEYQGEQGAVTFQLEGVSEIREGEVEVDADVDDPDIDNAAEFTVTKPEFSAVDQASIEVKD